MINERKIQGTALQRVGISEAWVNLHRNVVHFLSTTGEKQMTVLFRVGKSRNTKIYEITAEEA